MSSTRIVRKDTKGFYIQHEGMKWYAENTTVNFASNQKVEVKFSGIGLAGGGFAETIKGRKMMWISEGCP